MTISVANVTTAATSVYTSSGNTAVSFMSLCNYSGNTVTANVFVVPNGGSAGNSTVVLANLELTSEDTYQFYAGGEKLLLSNGDSVRVSASDNDTVTVVVSYIAV
jgi:hypothetical protein